MKKTKGPKFLENTPPSWCAVSADDQTVVTLAPKSESSCRLVRWDIRTGACGAVGIVKENCENGALSPMGDRAAAVGSYLWLFDEKGALVHKLPAWVKDDVDASAVAFSPDGAVVVAVAQGTSYAAPIVAWSVVEGKEILRAELAPMIVGQRRKIGGRRVAFSPEGDRIVVWTDSDKVNGLVVAVIELATGATRAAGEEAPELSWILCNLDGSVVRSHQGLVARRPSLWASETITVTEGDGATRYELKGFTEKLWHQVFSPSGNYLAALAGREVHVWDLSTGQRVVDPSP